MLVGTYNPSLVLVSLGVAVLASYTALGMANRVRAANGLPAARYWLSGGAFAMGIGIWAMHFVGMLAFSLPIDMGYDIPLTLLSLAIAIGCSAFALWTVCRDELSRRRLAVGALLMGAGIAAMHYVGMAAMRMQPGIVYHRGWFALSILIAVAASGAALWITYRLRHDGPRMAFLRPLASVAMGLAIVGMHYTGMQAAGFPDDSVCLASNGGLSAGWLAGHRRHRRDPERAGHRADRGGAGQPAGSSHLGPGVVAGRSQRRTGAAGPARHAHQAAQPHSARRPHGAGHRKRQPAQGLFRGAVLRPGRFQGGQRRLRPPYRRRAAHRPGATHPPDSAHPGHRCATGRRRIHRPERSGRTDRRRQRGRPPDQCHRAARDGLRPRSAGDIQRGHRHLSQRRRGHPRAADQRRRRHVSRQAPGRHRLQLLRAVDERRRARTDRAAARPAAGAGARPVRAALPAQI